MYERLILIKELLADDGKIFVHCDSKKSHQLRCILDEIFGEGNFINEIIWHYRKWSTKIKAFQKNHDNILWYNKNKNNSERIFKVVDYETPSEGTLRRWKGKKQRADFDESGKRTATELDEESSGSPLSDVWYEQDLEDVQKVSIINPAASERTNYPTQKPEELLRRIIEATTNVDDVVFDCFMGSGTTQAVAMKLGRRFIGADINLGAVQTTTKRLLGVAQELKEQQQQTQLEVEEEEPTNYYTGFEVYNVNHYDIFRNPVQAKDLLIQALEINPIERNNLFDGEKDGRMIKIMPVNRIATRADLSELITGFDYKAFEKSYAEHSNKAVEKITLVCMGHEPDLAAQLQNQVKPFHLDVEVVDILRDKSNLEFKRDSEADITIKKDYLVIEKFYPMNLLQKLSLQKENVENWREMVESVMIDWNYDGAVLEPQTVDIPSKSELVEGKYKIPDDAGTIRVKITDLLSESVELEVQNG
jgi:DNA modification methylase